MLAGTARECLDDLFLLERRSPFFSEACINAARRTDRLTDHATSPRHASTASPIKPRAAPTAINTVPSGVFDFCMYGASAVGGTVTTGKPSVEDADVAVEPAESVVETVDVVAASVVVEASVVEVSLLVEAFVVVASVVDVESVVFPVSVVAGSVVFVPSVVCAVVAASLVLGSRWAEAS